MSVESYDVVIVGAGIVGCACAAELSRAGLRVAVVESCMVGGGATAAGMGHLAVMDDSPEQFALTRHSQLLWRQIAPDLPADAEYLRCGSLWIAADEMEMAEVRRKYVYYRERNVPVEILDGAALAEAEPNLRPGLVGALFMRDDAVLYSPNAARYLARQAQRHGARFYVPLEVVSLSPNQVQLSNTNRLTAEWIVLANGVAASAFITGLPMQPRKGHLVITDRYPGFVNHQLIELGYLKSAHSLHADSVAFNVQPRATGQLLIGSSRQYASNEPAIDNAILSRMLTQALSFMPRIKDLQIIRSWTGFRAATPDKLPLIGPHPEHPSVYLATGHEGLGISTSLATAQILADQLLNRQPGLDAQPYLPARVEQHV